MHLSPLAGPSVPSLSSCMKCWPLRVSPCPWRAFVTLSQREVLASNPHCVWDRVSVSVHSGKSWVCVSEHVSEHTLGSAGSGTASVSVSRLHGPQSPLQGTGLRFLQLAWEEVWLITVSVSPFHGSLPHDPSMLPSLPEHTSHADVSVLGSALGRTRLTQILSAVGEAARARVRVCVHICACLLQRRPQRKIQPPEGDICAIKIPRSTGSALKGAGLSNQPFPTGAEQKAMSRCAKGEASQAGMDRGAQGSLSGAYPPEDERRGGSPRLWV